MYMNIVISICKVTFKPIQRSTPIKSNEIKFYLKLAMHIWKKRKLTRSYLPDYILLPITISYIFDLSILVHDCQIEHDHQMKIYFSEF